MRFFRRNTFWLVVALVGFFRTTEAPADEPATDRAVGVVLEDGRKVSGCVDAWTDDRHLWLRRREQSVEVTSGFKWSQIDSVETDEGAYQAREFQKAVKKWQTAGQGFASFVVDDDARPNKSPPRSPPRRVQTLIVDAALGQWDDDALPDGLDVVILPLDAAGDLVPVRGDVELTLFGEWESVDAGRNESQWRQFPELERIGHLVLPKDFQFGPPVYRLPFSRVHPEVNVELSALGLLHARLGVNGQGSFEASDSEVCLRPLNWFRDRLQQYSRTRFLPIERTGRSPHR